MIDKQELTDVELMQMNIETHAMLEYSAEQYTKLFGMIATLKAERDEYKARLQTMIDIYQTNKYSIES